MAKFPVGKTSGDAKNAEAEKKRWKDITAKLWASNGTLMAPNTGFHRSGLALRRRYVRLCGLAVNDKSGSNAIEYAGGYSSATLSNADVPHTTLRAGDRCIYLPELGGGAQVVEEERQLDRRWCC